jgi:hypothetical protein
MLPKSRFERMLDGAGDCSAGGRHRGARAGKKAFQNSQADQRP